MIQIMDGSGGVLAHELGHSLGAPDTYHIGLEALGYLVPSNHPHYFYHLEYIHGENSAVGVGPRVEGMLISVVNLGRTSYL